MDILERLLFAFVAGVPRVLRVKTYGNDTKHAVVEYVDAFLFGDDKENSDSTQS